MITEAELRIKAAIDAALDAGETDAKCDIKDLLDLLDELSRAHLRVQVSEAQTTKITQEEWTLLQSMLERPVQVKSKFVAAFKAADALLPADKPI